VFLVTESASHRKRVLNVRSEWYSINTAFRFIFCRSDWLVRQAKSLLWHDISREYTQELCSAVSDRKKFESLLDPVLHADARADTAPVLFELFYNAVKYKNFFGGLLSLWLC
jgi:hypothetical protein